MTDLSENYWPNDLFIDDEDTPLSVLRDQAAKLGERTGNLVEARVETSGDSTGYFKHTLNLIIPALPEYRYILLTVYAVPSIYPTIIKNPETGKSAEAHNLNEFKEALREVLSSEYVKQVVRNMLTFLTSEQVA